MFGEIFYHGSIKKLVTAFGTLFNEMYVVRYNSNGTENSRSKVPLVYAPKQKYIVRNAEDENNDKQVAVVYPRMAFYVVSMERASVRQLTRTGLNTKKKTDEDIFLKQLNPVPYDVHIDLCVIGKNADEVFQLVERIVPYFNPQYTITINSIPSLGLKDDIAITLKQNPFDDSFDGPFDEKRSIIWTFQFVARTNFYGRILEQGLIRKIQTDLLVPVGEITEESMAETPRSARIIIEPDPIDAISTDDFGFSRTITEYDDAKKFNPQTLEDEPIPEEE